VRSILLPASERSAVALDRSNHRWRVVSRSRTSPLIGTSAGPHSTYSRTDFVLKLRAKIVKVESYQWMGDETYFDKVSALS
jgi:hypothetical protein